jgi:hypothetical protein
MGSVTWPPDIFGPADWSNAPKIITIQDEYYRADRPREWTAAERKYALIIRDPLTYRYDRKLLEWLKDQSNESLAGEVNNLQQELETKWHFRIYIPRTVLNNIEEALSRIELGHIRRPWRPIFAKPQAVTDLRKRFSNLFIDQKARKIFITGYEHTGIIYCPPPLIPIAIDPTRLTLHDADRAMKAVWNMVKPDIKKSRGESRKGWTPTAAAGEPEALARVLRCLRVNFEKYLKWYDLHTAGLPFRLIAHCELKFKDPERREAKFDELIKMRKHPKVGKEVKAESAVKKGAYLIMSAIYREKAPSDEDKILLFGEFICPDHENNECSLDCHYLKEWMKRFDKQTFLSG